MSEPNDKQEPKFLQKEPDSLQVVPQELSGGAGGGKGTSEGAVDVGGSTDSVGVDADGSTDNTGVDVDGSTNSVEVDAGVLPAQGFTPDGHTWQDIPSPGSLENAVHLTNEFTTPFGIGHPTNTGECPLSINGLDENGRIVPGSASRGGEPEGHRVLQPGESVPWYYAPPGSVAIAVAAFDYCHGHAQLTYDTPVS